MASRAQIAAALMARFADRTGLGSGRPPHRYLWTDAFAVCNFFALAQTTGESRYRELALGLIEQVHRALGRHRPDDARSGWISGLGDREGEAHPTRGGLRIGKRLPERGAGEPFDERLEWDRDGQYFHYLTKWMHALDQASRWTRQPLFNSWARELAATAHAAFVKDGRMFWKMSIDLSRPLVPSMGHHDPLDGYVTCLALEATASRLPSTPRGPSLALAIADYERMIQGRNWSTDDPLGIGGLLMDAARLTQLGSHSALTERLLDAAREGLSHYTLLGETKLPASRRLAFRELGLAIGLHALPWLGETLAGYAQLGSAIEAFWLDADHQRVASWYEHRDINEVMLATSLVPGGMLVLPRVE